MADTLWYEAKLKKQQKTQTARRIQGVDYRQALDQRARRINSNPILAALDERECSPGRDGHPAPSSPKTYILKNRWTNRFRVRVLL